MSKKSSLTITSAMEVYQQIGKQLSETGLGVPMSTKDQEELESQDILKQIPLMFQIDGSVFLELRSQEIRQSMGVSNDFPLNKGIDDVALDMCQKYVVQMEPCKREDIAIALETIASTFQCKVPDDFGLTQYFNLLEQYPRFCIENATHTLLTTYTYPRLPLPKDFIDICQPMYIEHRDWLIKTSRRFYQLEVWKQMGGKVVNKYLPDVEET
jgi:hypothetical protein